METLKLAISNIGWTDQEEPEIAQLLKQLEVKYIELAPTKHWQEPIDVSDEEIVRYKEWWAGYDIEVVAFQSMLFTHPDYKIFESEDNRNVTKEYLEKFIQLAGKIGAKRLVFGSPKNRQCGNMPTEEANEIAERFFNSLGNAALENGVIFCIEPNAPQYNCDFITNASEGINLVNRVNNPGFGLHLDTACMTLARDNLGDAIRAAGNKLKHFHISSPMLDQVEERDDVAHQEAAKALQDINYEGYVSIEMKPSDSESNAERVKRAVLYAQSVYNSSW